MEGAVSYERGTPVTPGDGVKGVDGRRGGEGGGRGRDVGMKGGWVWRQELNRWGQGQGLGCRG